MDKKNAVLDMTKDAIFLPGKIHGCENELYIIYENPQANDGKGSMEIEILDRDTLTKLYSDVNGDIDSFFELMPDYFQGKWCYADAGKENHDYEDLCKAYKTADFIVGRDGGIKEKFQFIMDWVNKDAENVVYDMVDNDAIFLPGNELHGSEDYLYIIYENPDANDGEGCIEIEIVDRDTLLEIYSIVDGNAERFFAVMPDYFHGKWEYAVPGTDDYKSLCEAYPKADFIFGRDGGLEEELKFIMDWVIKSGTEKIDTDFGCFYCIPTLFNSYRITDMHRKLIRIVGECEKKAIVTGAKNAKSIEELVSKITECDWLSDDWKDLVEGLNLQEYYHSEEEILKHDWCFQIGKHLFFVSEP